MFGWLEKFFKQRAENDRNEYRSMCEHRETEYDQMVDIQRQQMYGHDPKLLAAARTLPIVPVCRITDSHGIEIGLDTSDGLSAQRRSDERFVYQKATMMEHAARETAIRYNPEEARRFYTSRVGDQSDADRLLEKLESTPPIQLPLKPTPPQSIWKKESEGG